LLSIAAIVKDVTNCCLELLKVEYKRSCSDIKMKANGKINKEEGRTIFKKNR
jgi:hypothetical protein